MAQGSAIQTGKLYYKPHFAMPREAPHPLTPMWRFSTWACRMVSFFSSVKSEVADRFERCGAAKKELVDCIDVFYNQRRRLSTLGQISPAAFERRTGPAREGQDGTI